MDDLGFNKIAGAVLATGLGMMLLMKLPSVFLAHADDSIAYTDGYDPDEKVGPTEAEPELPFPQQSWVDAMDATAGAKQFKKCASCHNVDADGANGTGPALYGIVGNDIGVQAGYSYSGALTGLPGNWTYEALDSYLEKPALYAPGTKMNFNGLKKPEQRAAVIEYLRVADGSPEAKPAAAPADVIETEMVETEVLEPDVMEDPKVTKDEE